MATPASPLDTHTAGAAGPLLSADLCAVLDRVTIGMALTDLEGGWIVANPALCRTLGYSREELLALPAALLLSGGDLAALEADAGRLLDGAADTAERVVHCRHADGRALALALSVSALCDQAGAPYAILTQVQDVTEREAARAFEACYQALIEQLPAIVYRAQLDAASSTTYVSPQVEQILGFTPEEWLADPELWLRLVHPEDRARVLASAADTQRGDRADSLVYRSLTRDGRTLWLHDLSRTVRDEAGQPLFLQGIVFDITQQKEAEAAARASEEQYRSLIESLDSIVAVVDPAGIVLYINRVGAQTLGAEPQALVGAPLRALSPFATSQLVPVKDVMRENRGLVVEIELTLRDGPRWYRASLQPVRDGAGRPAAVLIKATDVHDLKAAQHELLALNQTLEERVRQRTAEVQDLYDRAPAGYHSLDGDGRVLQVNEREAAWLGLPREEVIGRSFTDFLTPQSQQTFRANFPRLKDSGEIHDVELDLVLEDGGTLPVRVSATAIFDESGAFVASRSTLTDNRAQRAAELALRRANAELARAARAKDEFLSTMSHELRTPLHGILTLAELLLEQARGPLNERQLRSVQGIQESGAHLLALINDILDVSKIDADHLELEWEDLSAAEVCQAAAGLVRELALKKRVTLSLDLGDVTAAVRADPRRLKQMLVNLLSNAVKFTPGGGSVKVTVGRPAEGAVAFSVADTGIGIAAGDLPKLFQPFTQLDSSLSRQQEGTGLGLALVRKLAELHHGAVSVVSEPGAGSTFTLTLPSAAPAGAARGARQGEAEASAGSAQLVRGTVLLVDDTQANRDAASDYLTGRGYTVWLASGAEEGIATAQARRPDAILMDVQMPGVDGLEAIRRLRADPECARIPIIALTALAMPGDRERGLAAGADAYVTKPVVMRQLVELIEELRRSRG